MLRSRGDRLQKWVTQEMDNREGALSRSMCGVSIRHIRSTARLEKRPEYAHSEKQQVLIAALSSKHILVT